MRKRRGFCDEAEMADRDGTGWLRRQIRTWEWRNQNPNDLAKISMRIPMMRRPLIVCDAMMMRPRRDHPQDRLAASRPDVTVAAFIPRRASTSQQFSDVSHRRRAFVE